MRIVLVLVALLSFAVLCFSTPVLADEAVAASNPAPVSSADATVHPGHVFSIRLHGPFLAVAYPFGYINLGGAEMGFLFRDLFSFEVVGSTMLSGGASMGLILSARGGLSWCFSGKSLAQRTWSARIPLLLGLQFQSQDDNFANQEPLGLGLTTWTGVQLTKWWRTVGLEWRLLAGARFKLASSGCINSWGHEQPCPTDGVYPTVAFVSSMTFGISFR